MSIIGILVMLSIFTAIFGTYRATTNAGSSLEFNPWNRSRVKSPRLHFLTKEANISSRRAEPRHIVFHLQGIVRFEDISGSSRKDFGISLNELEKCIPWVPMDHAIFIDCAEGFTPTVLKRLKSLNTTRDLYLIDGSASKACESTAMEA